MIQAVVIKTGVCIKVVMDCTTTFLHLSKTHSLTDCHSHICLMDNNVSTEHVAEVLRTNSDLSRLQSQGNPISISIFVLIIRSIRVRVHVSMYVYCASLTFNAVLSTKRL